VSTDKQGKFGLGVEAQRIIKELSRLLRRTSGGQPALVSG
jgi:hypothetical protein